MWIVVCCEVEIIFSSFWFSLCLSSIRTCEWVCVCAKHMNEAKDEKKKKNWFLLAVDLFVRLTFSLHWSAVAYVLLNCSSVLFFDSWRLCQSNSDSVIFFLCILKGEKISCEQNVGEFAYSVCIRTRNVSEKVYSWHSIRHSRISRKVSISHRFSEWNIIFSSQIGLTYWIESLENLEKCFVCVNGGRLKSEQSSQSNHISTN